MGFKCGIVGLPNVGKSTLFNALTESDKAEAANYPFATIEPNIGRVSVPDKRLQILSNINGIPVSTSAVVVTVVAILGLRTWRKELTRKARFEEARNVMSQAMRREALFTDRISSFTSPSESSDRTRDNSESTQETSALNNWYA